jgi:hypothetical protein
MCRALSLGGTLSDDKPRAVMHYVANRSRALGKKDK